MSEKLERLLTGYLDQVVDEQDYRTEKSKLLLSKKSLEEEMTSLSHKQNDWLAPFQNWLKDAQSLDKIASDSDLFAKKVCGKEIFGSHLCLASRAARGEPVFPYLSALRVAESIGKIPESLILVYLYNHARTYFSKNF